MGTPREHRGTNRHRFSQLLRTGALGLALAILAVPAYSGPTPSQANFTEYADGASKSGPAPTSLTNSNPDSAFGPGSTTASTSLPLAAAVTATGSYVEESDAGVSFYFVITGPAGSTPYVPVDFTANLATNVAGVAVANPASFGRASAAFSSDIGGTSLVYASVCTSVVDTSCETNAPQTVVIEKSQTFDTGVAYHVSLSATCGENGATCSAEVSGIAIGIDPAFAAANPGYTIQFSTNVLAVPGVALVPNVVGDAQSVAIGAITSAGLLAGASATQASTSVPAGDVISQTPSAGTLVSQASTVSLVISSGPPSVVVPNVTNDPLATATKVLGGVGLMVGSVTTQSSATVAAGSVIAQLPMAGAMVADGSAVNLVLSSGVPTVAVPNLVGDPQTDAGPGLAAVGLALGTITTQTSSSVAAGIVISESPAAGTLLSVGSTVNLVVSSGPPPSVVPNVVGDTLGAATSVLSAAGYFVGDTIAEYSATVPSGDIVSQQPPAGTALNTAVPVVLYVSSGNAPVVPNVVGDTVSAATGALGAVGYSVGDTIGEYSATVPAGDVVSQQPPAGTAQNTAVPVVLYFSFGPAPVIPDVVGDTLSTATSIMKAAGYFVGDVVTVASATEPAGQVIAQQPPAGTTGLSNAVPVVLTVSAGPVPSVIITLKGAPVVTRTALGYTVAIALQNTGTATAETVVESEATLNESLQVSALTAITNLAPGAVINLVLNFPAAAGPSGLTARLAMSGSYSAATLSGTWGFGARVTLP